MGLGSLMRVSCEVFRVDLIQFIAAYDPLDLSGVHHGRPVAHMGDHMAVVTDQKVGHLVRRQMPNAIFTYSLLRARPVAYSQDRRRGL